jgi:hypothetical protein
MSTSDDSAALRLLLDRQAITDVLHKYSSSIDSFDYDGVRSTFADDVWAHYGFHDPAIGGDTVTAWIKEATASVVWQHHLLSVYSVEIDGDSAKTLSYLTSFQVFKENPKTAVILVARYHDELRREATGWKLSRRIMEVLWGETREDQGTILPDGPAPRIWIREA